jgi:Caspase domain
LPDDILLSLDGVEAENAAAFVSAVRQKVPNATVKLRFLRAGREKRIAVMLGVRPVAQGQAGAPEQPVAARKADVQWNAISVSGAPPAGIKGRVILIGNSHYKFFGALAGPDRDVQAAASRFAQVGFETVVLRDPDKDAIVSAIKSSQNDGSQQLLGIYYSGHAAEIDRENTIVLTGFDPSQKDDSNLLPIKTLLSLLAAAGPSKVFVIFDACRDFFDPASGDSETKRALIKSAFQSYRGAGMSAADLSSLNRKEYSVVFSTSEREVALDRSSLGISPFTKSFVTALTRETSFIQAMLLAKRLTEEETGGRQSPDLEIKWNSDLRYSTSQTVKNSALFELNYNMALTPDTFQDQGNAAKIHSVLIRDQGMEYNTLSYEYEKSNKCKHELDNEYSNFYWAVSILNIEFCFLKELKIREDSSRGLIFGSDPAANVYNNDFYTKALWTIDIDFDGEPEMLRAELRNADMSLIFKSKTKEIEFRGLVGPNIKFLGLFDFNRDGVLDIFLEFGTDNGSELIILDGKRLADERFKSEKCLVAVAWSKSDLCRRLVSGMKSMKGSLFSRDVDNAYYGGDILQYTLYNDWNIKSWQLDDQGVLSVTTYSPTWDYEHFIPENYMPNKTISFNPGSGKIQINLDGEKRVALATIEDRIALGK